MLILRSSLLLISECDEVKFTSALFHGQSMCNVLMVCVYRRLRAGITSCQRRLATGSTSWPKQLTPTYRQQVWILVLHAISACNAGITLNIPILYKFHCVRTIFVDEAQIVSSLTCVRYSLVYLVVYHRIIRMIHLL